MKKLHWPVYLTIVLQLSCNQRSEYSTDGKVYATEKQDAIVCTPANKSEATGMQDVGTSGHLKITSSRSKLHLLIGEFKKIPFLGLHSWAAFTPFQDSTMVIGDIMITGSDLVWVEQEVVAQGLIMTDFHQLLARDGSIILYMHIIGFGNNATLSNNVRAFLAKLNQVGATKLKEPDVNNTIINLDTALLDSIMGYKGKIAGDVYKYTMGRHSVLKAHGVPVSTYSEFNTWAAWKGKDENSVVAGGVTILKNELAPVVKALVENGFEIVHNQLVHEELGVCLLHYWGVGDPEKLATGLKAALLQQEME